MAKPFQQITKTELYQHYNLVKVYDGETLMKSLSTIKPNHLYAEYKHRKDHLEPPAWFDHWSKNVYEKQPPAWFDHWSKNVYEKQPPAWFKHWCDTEFKPIITGIEDKLNKHDELFRQHGWMK